MAADLPWDYQTALESNPNFKQSDIDALRSWIQGLDASSIIPRDVTDKMLLCFHNACSLVMEDTKKCIKTYYSIRDKAPEHFDDRDMDLTIMKESAQAVQYAVLPEKTDDGYMIVFHRLSDFSPDKYNFNPCVKMLFMTIDRLLLENGPIKGLVFLFDMRGVKLGHLTRVNISSLAKFFTYIQDGMPVRIKKINIMNTVAFFDKVMMLMKPFMKKELISLLNLHPTNLDLETFHKNILPKRCVLPDYGGDLPDAVTINKKNVEKLTEYKPYFETEEKHRYIYSKKSKKKSKVEKGFQDLCID